MKLTTIVALVGSLTIASAINVSKLSAADAEAAQRDGRRKRPCFSVIGNCPHCFSVDILSIEEQTVIHAV